MTRWIAFAALLLASSLAPQQAAAILHAGDVTPDFHKTGLDNQPYTLYQYRGKVVVLFLLGYN